MGEGLLTLDATSDYVFPLLLTPFDCTRDLIIAGFLIPLLELSAPIPLN